MKKLLTALPVLLIMALSLRAAAATWQIDPAHSSAGFTVRHMMVSNVHGFFSKLSGTVDYDPKNLAESHIETVIEAASIDTRNAKRDEHLRSADFFDVANHPTISFRSRRIESAGEGKLRVVGDLTIRGVTKEVLLDVEGPTPEIQAQGAFRMGASASTSVNRKDFGVNWNRALDGGGVVVGDKVRIDIEVELVRKPAPASTN